MQTDVVAVLRCTLCHGDLVGVAGSLRCPSGHTFDVARQGYVNLVPGGTTPPTADTAEQVAARGRFLDQGHFDTIATAVAAAVERHTLPAPVVVDLGAGTGHYLVAVLDRLAGRVGVAIDTSKFAVRRAARAHPRAGAVVADVWRPLPVRSAAVGAVLNVFAPRNLSETARVLAPGGIAVVVTPTPGHLAELVSPLDLVTVDPGKREQIEASLPEDLLLERRDEIRDGLVLAPHDVVDLVTMGPSARHLDPEQLAASVAALGAEIPVTAAVDVWVLRRRGG